MRPGSRCESDSKGPHNGVRCAADGEHVRKVQSIVLPASPHGGCASAAWGRALLIAAGHPCGCGGAGSVPWRGLGLLALGRPGVGQFAGAEERGHGQGVGVGAEGFPSGVSSARNDGFPTQGVDVGAGPAGGEKGLVDKGGDSGEAKTRFDVGRRHVDGYFEEM